MINYSLDRLDYNSFVELGSINFDEDHIFDLSNLSFATPDGVVLFRLLLYEISTINGRNIKIILPNKESGKYSVRRYLTHIKIFRGLNISLQIKDKIYRLAGKLILPEEINSLSHTHLIDSTNYDLDKKMNELVLVLVKFLKDNGMIRENKENIYRNVFDEAFLNHRNHSNPDKRPAYFCAQAQVYKKGKPRIVLSMGDCGVGIRGSLNTEFSYETDKRAIKAAIEEQKSRHVGNEDRGGGARFIFEKSRALKLNCRLRSGDTEINQLKGNRNFLYRKTSFIPGTQLFLWS